MIPQWNNVGILPPIRPGQEGNSPDRSPYRVPLSAIVNRFATSPERIGILRGFVTFRGVLAQAGLTDGFQWLNGSFMENKEALLGQSPNDIDVVTFYRLPAGKTQGDLAAANPQVFQHDSIKGTYRVDAFFRQLDKPLDRDNIQRIVYWYSMWSHRRNEQWKGFLQVELSPVEDKLASDMLNAIEQGGASK